MKTYLYNIIRDKEKGFVPAIIKAILFSLSLAYNMSVRLVSFFYLLKPISLNCTVISVGNITWGGTGKTPLVEYIACLLKEHGHKVVILSRGYKKETGSGNVSACLRLGDEPYMLEKVLGDIPVLVDSNRVRAARFALSRYYPDTIILDDGFQQWKIKKDLEILVVDAGNPFGNSHLIPRGILREPLSSLKRPDIFVMTKTDLASGIEELKDCLSRINPRAQIAESIHLPVSFYKAGQPQENFNPDKFKAKSVAAISAIGDPDSFKELLKKLGINILMDFDFRDHYFYKESDIKGIAGKVRKCGLDTIVTTEKDSVKLAPFISYFNENMIQVFVLRIKIKITKNEEEFHNRLFSLYPL